MRDTLLFLLQDSIVGWLVMDVAVKTKNCLLSPIKQYRTLLARSLFTCSFLFLFYFRQIVVNIYKNLINLSNKGDMWSGCCKFLIFLSFFWGILELDMWVLLFIGILLLFEWEFGSGVVDIWGFVHFRQNSKVGIGEFLFF